MGFLDETGLARLWAKIKSALNGKADTSHTHTKAQITDFPVSLPANGGNSDTVDNKHASDFATSIHSHSKIENSGQHSEAGFDSRGGFDVIVVEKNVLRIYEDTDGNITTEISDDVDDPCHTLLVSESGVYVDGNRITSMASGPDFGSSTTTYLRNDGTWDTPSGGSGLQFVEIFNGYQNSAITINNYKDYKFFIVTVCSNLSSETSTFPALVIPAKYIASTGQGLGFSAVTGSATTNITYRINRYSAASETNYVSVCAYASSVSATSAQLQIRGVSSGTGYFKSVIGVY